MGNYCHVCPSGYYVEGFCDMCHIRKPGTPWCPCPCFDSRDHMSNDKLISIDKCPGCGSTGIGSTRYDPKCPCPSCVFLNERASPLSMLSLEQHARDSLEKANTERKRAEKAEKALLELETKSAAEVRMLTYAEGQLALTRKKLIELRQQAADHQTEQQEAEMTVVVQPAIGDWLIRTQSGTGTVGQVERVSEVLPTDNKVYKVKVLGNEGPYPNSAWHSLYFRFATSDEIEQRSFQPGDWVIGRGNQSGPYQWESVQMEKAWPRLRVVPRLWRHATPAEYRRRDTAEPNCEGHWQLAEANKFFQPPLLKESDQTAAALNQAQQETDMTTSSTKNAARKDPADDGEIPATETEDEDLLDNSLAMDLPEEIREAARKAGIGFEDLTDVILKCKEIEREERRTDKDNLREENRINENNRFTRQQRLDDINVKCKKDDDDQHFRNQRLSNEHIRALEEILNKDRINKRATKVKLAQIKSRVKIKNTHGVSAAQDRWGAMEVAAQALASATRWTAIAGAGTGIAYVISQIFI